jgi:hypothetical protein
MLEQIAILCPYCGEEFTALVDCSIGDQTQIYYEDCVVCCQPILFRARVDEPGKLSCLETFREDE